MLTPGENCIPNVSDKYKYPTFTNEMLSKLPYDKVREARSQVPVSAVKKMSTFGLIATLLDAPGFYSYFMISSDLSSLNRRDGLHWHNSVPELLKRKDAAQSLMSFYGAIKFDCVSVMDGHNIDDLAIIHDFFTDVSIIELLFSEETVLAQLNRKKEQALTGMILEKHKKKEEVKGDLVIYSYSLFAMLHLMLHANYEPFTDYYNLKNESVKAYLSDGYYSVDQSNEIISFAEDFIIQ
jgi:hypothetical protein